MNIVLLGPPGAGKGTQAKRLHKSHGLPIVASGDIFRALQREDSAVGREVRAIMARGDYVPDELTIKLVLERLAQADARGGFLLDGFPRTQVQAQALDSWLAERGRRVDLALYINAPTDVLVRRVTERAICSSCGAIYNLSTRPPKLDMVCDVCGHAVEARTDAEPDVIAKRLEVHQRQTRPLVDYYRRLGVLAEIDGTQTVDAVEGAVDEALREAAGTAREAAR